MSQESLNEIKPKRFLKKGEGLKRFAAYKPPLPVTGQKRRQTFVKFKLDDNIYSKILNDDSINLSTEIPKIPPPKIMHTPIRPRQNNLGPLRQIPYNVMEDSSELFATPLHTNSPPIPTLIAKKSSQSKPEPKNVEHPSARHDAQPKLAVEKKRYNLRGSRKQTPESAELAEPKEAKKVGRRRVKAVVERHVCAPTDVEQLRESPSPVVSESQINVKLDNLFEKIQQKKSTLNEEIDEDLSDEHDIDGPRQIMPQKFTKVHDLSTPTPGSCLLALGRHIQQIEATVNELKEKIKHCECGALASPKPPPATRASRRAASHQKTTVDSTPRVLKNLMDNLAQLNMKFDEMNFGK